MTTSDPQPDHPDAAPAHADNDAGRGTYGGRGSVESVLADADEKGAHGTYGGRVTARPDPSDPSDPADANRVTDETYGGGPTGPGATDAGVETESPHTEERTR